MQEEKKTYYIKLGNDYFTNPSISAIWGNKREALSFPSRELAYTTKLHFPDARIIRIKSKSPYIMKEYDKALEQVLSKGIKKSSRAGDVLSIFGIQIEYDISKYFPILTGRKLFPRSIFAELVWMLSGSTDIQDLENLGSKIWTPWVSEEFTLANHGYKEKEIGPGYGFQLRQFGAPYINRTPGMKELYQNRPVMLGFDQVSYIVDELKNNPTSRRIMWSLWCPEMTTNQVRLPTCHYSFLANVEGDKLNGMVVSRSCDLPIGAPANVIFYAGLIYALAQQVGLKPGKLVHSIADAHCYANCLEEVEEYLKRDKPNSPTLTLNPRSSIFDYIPDDFEVNDYNPLAKIVMSISV